MGLEAAILEAHLFSPMPDFTITTNIPEVEHRLDRLARSQIPFATALALTWTANDGRDELQKQLPDRFILRSTWVQRGIRSRPASKRRLESAVFSRDPFMVKQERGGTKKPRNQHIALPRRIRSSPKQRITRAKRPGRVLQKANVFLDDLPNAPGRQGIFRRVGRRGTRRLLYVLDSRTMRIKPRFEAERTVHEVVRRRFDRNFGRALARSIATSR